MRAWHTPIGLFERYRYEPGRAGRGEVHAHAQVQLCLSNDFPGRYRLGRRAIEVPEQSVSLVDAWEPHAVEDPIDRAIVAHYLVLYVPRACWDRVATGGGRNPRSGVLVRRDRATLDAFRRLYASARVDASPLEQQERLIELAMRLLPSNGRPPEAPNPRAGPSTPASLFTHMRPIASVSRRPHG